MKALGFNYTQIEDLQILHSILMEDKAQIRRELEKKEQKLEELLSDVDTPVKEIRKLEDEISKLRNDILTTDVEAMLKVKKMLSPKQYLEFRKLIWKEGDNGAPCKNR